MLALLLALTARTTPVMWAEAESCEIVWAARRQIGESTFASGGKIAPNYWGQTLGDKVTWKIDLEDSLDAPWLAVRYAFDKRAFNQAPNNPRKLTVTLNGKPVGQIDVPDTGSWQQFQVAWLQLPDLKNGHNTIAVETSEVLTNTDLDCLGLFWPRNDATPPFLDTVAARSPDGRFIYRRTANASAPEAPRLFREFTRIYNEMDKTGWAPITPIGINSVEDARWANPSWSAWSNDFGCYFHSGIVAKDFGNWCHEMTHLMFRGHCPPWLEEPFVRVISANVWIDRLYPVAHDVEAHLLGLQRALKDFNENPDRTYESIEPILNALAAKFGPEVLTRFLRAAAKDAQALVPNQKLTRDQIVRYFTEAAGEDAAPYFKRWTGFTSASTLSPNNLPIAP